MSGFLSVVVFLTAVWLAVKAIKKAIQAAGDKRREAEFLARASSLTNAACQFVSRVNSDRCFPEISSGNVSMKKGEFAILGEVATLFEPKTHRIGSSAGQSVRVGRVRFYSGASHFTSYEALEPIASGNLLLTNLRIIFMTDLRSVVIPLKDAVGVSVNLDEITIHTPKRNKPYVFAVGNPILWAMFSKVGASRPFETRFIPDGVTLKASPTGTPGDVKYEMTTETDDEPVRIQ